MKPTSQRKPLTDADYRALAEFRHQLRQFLLFSEEAVRMAGLQARHHQALLAIKGFPQATIGELAEWLGIRPHSTAELVDRLVAAKLVRRVADTVDRRRVHLRLTRMAQKRLEGLTLAHRGELARLATLWEPLFKVLGRADAPHASKRPRGGQCAPAPKHRRTNAFPPRARKRKTVV